MEKLATQFGLHPRMDIIERTEDWTGEEHGGEPLFYYFYRCSLVRDGEVIAEADGSCNSRESKYRYRWVDRVCPGCGAAAVIRGKAEYGGGWLCYKKRGGCGAKFNAGDARIEDQEAGRKLNEDVADLVNTIQKMAQKRALVAAVLIGVNASEFFTQDIEEYAAAPVVDAETGEVTQAPRFPMTSERQELLKRRNVLAKELSYECYRRIWKEQKPEQMPDAKLREVVKELDDAARAARARAESTPGGEE